MSKLRTILRPLAGLFVDDGRFALEIVAIVILAGAVAKLIPGVPLAAGGILLLGCLAVLLVPRDPSPTGSNSPAGGLQSRGEARHSHS